MDPELIVAEIELASLELARVDCAKRGVLRYMRDNATLVVAWKRSGLTHPQIASILRSMGFKASPAHVRQSYSKVEFLADSFEADRIKSSILRHSRERLAKAALSESQRESRARAAVSSLVPASVHAFKHPSQTKPESRASDAPLLSPSIARPAPGLPDEFVPVEGEDSDFESTALTSKPRSFGDFRRRLWESMTGPRKSPLVKFDDGESLQVPGPLQKPLLEGRVKSWRDLVDRM